MSDKNVNQKQETRLSNDQLWDKAATSEPITRADLGLMKTDTYGGLQNLNEGFNVFFVRNIIKTNKKGNKNT